MQRLSAENKRKSRPRPRPRSQSGPAPNPNQKARPRLRPRPTENDMHMISEVEAVPDTKTKPKIENRNISNVQAKLNQIAEAWRVSWMFLEVSRRTLEKRYDVIQFSCAGSVRKVCFISFEALNGIFDHSRSACFRISVILSVPPMARGDHADAESLDAGVSRRASKFSASPLVLHSSRISSQLCVWFRSQNL